VAGHTALDDGVANSKELTDRCLNHNGFAEDARGVGRNRWFVSTAGWGE
jgi:hypothetical protein